MARQAIFDRNLNVFGYEILFRSGAENVFKCADGDKASSSVIENLLDTFGVDALTLGKKAFINVTRRMLVQEYASLLPKERIVLEILEDVQADDAVLAACRNLKGAGYTLALDDYQKTAGNEPLIPFADIIKVDFRLSPLEERRAYAERHGKGGTRLLAEKVETRQELNEAIGLGYTLFQGYFFCKPEMMSRKDIPPYKLNYLRFLREVNQPEVDFDGLEKIIQQDVALSLKLLRYINSAMFGLRSKVDSIKRALVLLGVRPIKRWVSLLALAAMGDDKPGELIVTSLVRARFCEQVGQQSGLKEQAFELFMMGMLSAVDAILDRPMAELVNELPLSDQVKKILLGDRTGLGRVLGLALAYETGDWDRVQEIMKGLTVNEARIPEIYREAVKWASQIFEIGTASVEEEPVTA